MYTLFMAVTYLLKRRITLAAVLATALGVMVMVLVVSIISGYIARVEEILRGDTADLTIEMAGYRDQHEPIRKYRDVIGKVSGVKHVVACSPIISEFAIITFKSKKYDWCQIYGIDPAREKEVGEFRNYFKNPEKIDFDTLFSPEIHGDYTPIILGESVIELEGLGVGSNIELATSRSSGLAREQFKVIAFTHSGGFDIDSRRCYVSLAAARRMLGLRDDQVTQIKVKIDDPERLTDVKLAIASALSNPGHQYARSDTWSDEAENVFGAYRISPWREMKRTELRAAENDLRILSFIVVFIMLGAGFVIFAILVMIVFEKRKDIGIMMSVGSTWYGTISIFVIMGLIIGLLGIGLGLLLGKLASDNINSIGKAVETITGVKVFDAEIYKLEEIPSRFTWDSALWISAISMAVCLLSSTSAAIRAALVDPVKALRYE
ncbi:MAG: ABC transporter permease [Planctomycetota bacterium]